MATDKEYLTFCNASNLDWQYVKLGKETRGKDYRYPYLNELLDPKNFIKRNKDGKFAGYVYMPDVKTEGQITSQQKQDGIEKMRSKAGVLFNYLEEIKEGTSGEGSFLAQWEVIYAADSYKAYADYLDDMGEKSYPTREEIEKVKRKNFYIDIVVSVIDNAVSIYSGYTSVSAISKSEISSKLTDRLKNEAINNGTSMFDSDIVSYANIVRQYGKDVVKNAAKGETVKTILKNSPSATKAFSKKLGSDMKEKLEYCANNSHIKFSRKISFTSEINFKALVLKKNSEIVIVFNDKDIKDSRGLPMEVDLTRVVISKILKDHKGTIFLTGFNEGAHIASLVNLFYNSSFKEHYYYTKNNGYIKNLIDYTVEDYSDDYSSSVEIGVSFLGSAFKEIGIGSFFWSILVGGSLYGFVLFILSAFGKKGISAIFKLIESESISKNYDFLVDKEYIIREYKHTKENIIKGYVSDKIYNNDYIKFEDLNKNIINVFSGHMLYLNLKTKKLSLEKNSNGY